MRLILVTLISVLSSQVHAELSANLPNAIDYCEKQNQVLPSARQLAKFAMDHGAIGILEKTEYQKQPGYKPINKMVTRSSAEVDFYYNPEGYRSPEPENKATNYWSSTRGPQAFEFAYTFDFKTGKFAFSAWTQRNFLRCFEK